jgi:DNA repair protein RadD
MAARGCHDVAEDKRLSDFFDGQKVTLQIPDYDNPVTYLIEHGYLARPTFTSLNADAGLELSGSDVKNLADAIDVPDDVLEKAGVSTTSASDHNRN